MSTEVPPPLAQDEALSAATQHDHTDVVVVGFGVAGACAALRAAETGADVVLVERAGVSGGTSALSTGQLYLGGGTAVQEATGFADSAEEMRRYLEAVTPDPDHDKIRAYCDDSVELFTWLEGHGVQFERSFYDGKYPFQPGTEGLMWSGNELVLPFRDLATPAPRGHKALAVGEKGGASLMDALAAAVHAEPNIRVVFDTGVTTLVTDATGAVSGVATRSFDTRGVIDAHSVVLAMGGYVMNREMVATHTPTLVRRFLPLGNPYDDGLGIRLGISAGGEAIHMDGAFISSPFYPPGSLVKGIIVNRDGQRFVAEDAYHGRIASRILDQPDALAYLIVDSELAEWPEFGLTPFIDGWETVADMETALELPAGSLQATLQEHDAHARIGADPAFGKNTKHLKPLDVGPWAAFDLSPSKATYAGFTLGGLRTSIDGEVLRAGTTQPIAGLYAVGATASNLAQDGLGYASGVCLGEGAYFGRRAGEHAASARVR